MRLRSARFLLPLAVVILVTIIFVFFWRARSREVYGAAVALCPGPDRYGYTCEGADAYAYIDATTPTGLFADDAVVRIELPFPFVFYGVERTAVTASSNGNLQFSSNNALAFPSCLAPAAGMGDLISPYWADLDPTLYGALETQVVGQSPARIFVIEWDDVPLYGTDTDDRVTFAVQLFEGTNNIVFLYQDPMTTAAGSGGRAVTGIQSESQGLSLSFSCLQPVLPVTGGLRFPYPVEPNPDAGEPTETAGAMVPVPSQLAAKGPVADLIARYESQGPAALEQLRRQEFAERPPRAFDWRAADLTGDDRAELIAVWHGGPENPEAAQVAVLGTENGQFTPLFDRRLSTREEGYAEVMVEDVVDLTGDGRADILLRDRATGRVWVLAAGDEAIDLLDVPERCQGGLIARDDDADGRVAIVRDGCATPGRVSVIWESGEFVRVP